MATTGTIRNNFKTGYAVQLVWTVTSQSIANNTSTVNIKVQLVSTGSSYNINSSSSRTGTAIVDGAKYTFSFTAGLSGSQTKTLYDKTVTVSHASDGKKTCSFSFSVPLDGIYLSGQNAGTISKSGTGIFNTIPRASSFDSVSASTSYLNSTITYKYTPKSSSFYNRLVVKTGTTTVTTVNIGAKSASQQTGTLTLTSAQLNTVYSKYPKAVSAILTFSVETYSDSGYSSKVGTSVERNLTFTFPTSLIPSISSVTLSDTNSGISDRFGAYIQNKSKVNVITSASGVSGSTISSIKVIINGVTYTGSNITSSVLTKSGTISISIKATDSRGRSVTASRTITVKSYSPPKVNAFKCFRSSSDGTENYDGEYLSITYNFSITPVDNLNHKSYTIDYKLKSASSWTTLYTGSVYSLSETKITGAVFSVDHAYDVRIRVSDYFGSDFKIVDIPTSFTLMDLRSTGKGLAIGKVSEKDGFEVGIQSYFSYPPIIKSEDRVLWSGGWYMTAGHTCTLKEKISEQMNGVVLVFSQYTDGAITNSQFQSFFVPKAIVKNHAGAGHQFTLTGGVFTKMATKYLYINDSTITGHDNNGLVGTNYGITYDNKGYVLRYVIGV